MEPSPFINEVNRALRGLDPLNMRSLRSREPACIQALIACRKNSRADVRTALDPYANRQITDEAEWVYDDFLLFAFLCALIQFTEFKDTVEKLVSFRRRSEQGQKLTFLQDAERIAQSNVFVPNSMFTVVIADFLEKSVPDSGALRSAHREAVRSAHEGRMSAFEQAIASRCEEVVAELSISSSMSSSVIARNLWRRCKRVATAVYFVFGTIVAFAIGWIVWLYIFGGDQTSSWAEKIIALGATGLIVFVWGARRKGCKSIAYALVWAVAGASSRKAMRSLQGDEPQVPPNSE